MSELSTKEKDLVVAFCDGSDRSDGKIDYREFFITFFKAHVKDRLRNLEKATLKPGDAAVVQFVTEGRLGRDR